MRMQRFEHVPVATECDDGIRGAGRRLAIAGGKAFRGGLCLGRLGGREMKMLRSGGHSADL